MIWASACGGDGRGDTDTTTTTTLTTGIPTTSTTETSAGPTGEETTDDPTTSSDPTTGPTTDPTTSTTDETTTDETTTDDPTDPTDSETTTEGETESDSDSDTTGEPPELDAMCLVLHNGGNPASTTVVYVQPDGALDLGESLELPAGHSPETTDYRREGVVTCGGRYAHFALLDEHLLATVEVGFYGELTQVGPAISVPNIEGVLCDSDNDLLFAFGRAGGGEAHVRTFIAENDGTLTPKANVDVSYANPTDMQLYAALHPKTNILYLAGATGGSALQIHAIDYGDEGALVPDDVNQTGGNLLFGIHMAPSGDEMAFTSYNGVVAWHNLPDSGDVPPSNQMTVISGSEWQGGVDMVIRTDPSSDEHFYYAQTTGSTGTIRVAEFLGDQVMYYDQEPAPGKRSHLKLTYEDDLLLAVSQSGNVRSWQLDPEGVVLTEADNLAVDTTAQASTLIPCAF